MSSICALLSDSKTITSSRRLRNSGRKCPRRVVISSRLSFSGGWVNSPAWAFFMISSEPRLLVAMMMVLVKSTTRPLPSVRRPSSNTCRRMLLTSAWAFSISSSRITLYGRRRTRSVSWPPSS